MKAKRGTGPMQAVTLALLADGPKHFMEICRALDKPKGAIGPHLLRLMRYGLIERPERGVYALRKS
jgi:predicted transcriptional regulator